MAVAVDFRLGLERNLDIEYMNYRERLVSVISEETEVLALDRKRVYRSEIAIRQMG